jgi:hypothetical protein
MLDDVCDYLLQGDKIAETAIDSMYLVKSGMLEIYVNGMEEENRIATMYKGEIVSVKPFLHLFLLHVGRDRSDLEGLRLASEHFFYKKTEVQQWWQRDQLLW